MIWQVDPTSPRPLFEQVAASVRRAIAAGELTTGARLPSAADVAASLEINLHTVLRAYQLLRDEGLVELRRGRGAVVVAASPGHARLSELVRDLVAEGERLGLDRAALARLIKKETLS